jgi:hypothetical protein
MALNRTNEGRRKAALRQIARKEVEATLARASAEEAAEWEPLFRDGGPRGLKPKLTDFARVKTSRD